MILVIDSGADLSALVKLLNVRAEGAVIIIDSPSEPAPVKELKLSLPDLQAITRLEPPPKQHPLPPWHREAKRQWRK